MNEQERRALNGLKDLEDFMGKHPDLAEEAAREAAGEELPKGRNHPGEARDVLNQLRRIEGVLRNWRHERRRSKEAQQEVDEALEFLDRLRKEIEDALDIRK